MRCGRRLLWVIVLLLVAVMPLAQAKKGQKKAPAGGKATKKEALFVQSGNLSPGTYFLLPCALGTQKGIQASSVPQKNVRSRTVSCVSSIDHRTKISNIRVTCAGGTLVNESAEYAWANEFIVRLVCSAARHEGQKK